MTVATVTVCTTTLFATFASVMMFGIPGSGGFTQAVTSAQKCDALVGHVIGTNEATITSASLRPGGVSRGPTDRRIAEHCSVMVQANDSALKVGIHLPTEWNGRMLQQGGGGFKGGSGVPSATSAAADGYALVASNGGHDAADNANAQFASDGVKLTEYTYLAEHRAASFGKAVIQKFYGEVARRAYFEGCSTGGHDAMMEAQRYPQDFDGIVARAPAGNFIGLYLQFNRVSTAIRAPGGMLNAQKQKVLADAVLSRCDSLDGLADGIVSNVAACHYEPQSLRCAGGTDTGDTCLSDAQLKTVEAITTPMTTRDGRWSHPGYQYGGENHPAGWGSYIWPRAGEGSAQQSFSDQWVRGFITGDPSYDPTTFDPNQWLGALRLLGNQWQAFNPDLSAFQARGGKLIMWAGTTDTSVTPRDTARYHDMVVEKMGQANTDKTLETFLAPGVGHCGGGVGPDTVDLLQALSTWVERGTPPSEQGLTLRKLAQDGTATVSRPMCKYPSYPRYNGTGDPNVAASFTCSR